MALKAKLNLMGRAHRLVRRHVVGDQRYFYRAGGEAAKNTLDDRWADLALIADFRSTDTVLDMGSAEGLVAFEVAKSVGHVHCVEIDPERLKKAECEAARRQIGNV